MKDRLTIRLDESLKEDIKDSSDLVDLTPSEFIRVLYLCYKFSSPDDEKSLKNLLTRNLWNYRASLEREVIKNTQ